MMHCCNGTCPMYDAENGECCATDEPRVSVKPDAECFFDAYGRDNPFVPPKPTNALHEKAEREKGCEYCLQGEDLAYGHDSMRRTGRIYIDGNLLTADLYSESMAVAVCCCPMCGRRLEVKHDG